MSDSELSYTLTPPPQHTHSQARIPDVRAVGEPLQVFGHRAEVDEEAGEEEDGDGGDGPQEHGHLKHTKGRETGVPSLRCRRTQRLQVQHCLHAKRGSEDNSFLICEDRTCRYVPAPLRTVHACESVPATMKTPPKTAAPERVDMRNVRTCLAGHKDRTCRSVPLNCEDRTCRSVPLNCEDRTCRSVPLNCEDRTCRSVPPDCEDHTCRSVPLNCEDRTCRSVPLTVRTIPAGQCPLHCKDRTCRSVPAPMSSPRLCATSAVCVLSVRNMMKRRKSFGWFVIQYTMEPYIRGKMICAENSRLRSVCVGGGGNSRGLRSVWEEGGGENSRRKLDQKGGRETA